MIDNNMLWKTIYISFTRRMASYDEMYVSETQTDDCCCVKQSSDEHVIVRAEEKP